MTSKPLNSIVSPSLLQAIEESYQQATDHWVGDSVPERQDACEAEDIACDAMWRVTRNEWEQAMECAGMVAKLYAAWREHRSLWLLWVRAILRAGIQHQCRQEAAQAIWRPTEAESEAYYKFVMGDWR